MTYIPCKDNYKSTFIFLIGLLFLLTLFILASLGIIHDVICHFVFLIEAVFYTFILNKYVLPTYTYTVTSEDFTIVKALGQKNVLVCSIELSKICDVITYDEYKKREDTEIKSVYNYCANFSASSRYCLTFKYSGYKEAVIFEPNLEMVSMIKSYITSDLKENL